MIDGYQKPIDEQVKCLKEILFLNKYLVQVLEAIKELNIDNCYVVAGSINQTVFNYLHGYDITYNIKDYDIIYFDSDISYEAEDKIIKKIKKKLSKFPFDLDIKNEARVHLWYKDHFGEEIDPYTSVFDAISNWSTTVTCIGVRLEDDLKVYAPYGLDDLFGLTIRPIKDNMYSEIYEKKIKRWKEMWPKLKVINLEE